MPLSGPAPSSSMVSEEGTPRAELVGLTMTLAAGAITDALSPSSRQELRAGGLGGVARMAQTPVPEETKVVCSLVCVGVGGTEGTLGRRWPRRTGTCGAGTCRRGRQVEISAPQPERVGVAESMPERCRG